MSFNGIFSVLSATAAAQSFVGRGYRVYRIKCNSVGGSIRLRNGSASGTILFDETMAVGADAKFNSVPILFRDGVYVDVFPGGANFTIYAD